MDSLVTLPNRESPHFSPEIKSRDSIIIESLNKGRRHNQAAEVDVSVGNLPKALTITASEILDKLNEILEKRGAGNIQSLKPENHTPEATADRIVRGATAFFGVFAEQNPELEGEELLNAFMETIRSGIDEGYNDAFKTLEGLGAFQIDGVQSGVEKTRELIDEKLLLFEESKRKELGLDPINIEQRVSESTSNEVTKSIAENLHVEVVA